MLQSDDATEPAAHRRDHGLRCHPTRLRPEVQREEEVLGLLGRGLGHSVLLVHDRARLRQPARRRTAGAGQRGGPGRTALRNRDGLEQLAVDDDVGVAPDR